MNAVPAQMRSKLPTCDLVTRARNGDQQAWDALVDRYATLVCSVCGRYGLSGADANRVSRIVWLNLADQLDRIGDPAALPGWLATATVRECRRIVRVAQPPQATGLARAAATVPDRRTGAAEPELLIVERHAALREALADLPLRCQHLIALLIENPPRPHAEISAKLGIPVEDIGLARSCCLDRLRRHPSVAATIDAIGLSQGSRPNRAASGAECLDAIGQYHGSTQRASSPGGLA